MNDEAFENLKNFLKRIPVVNTIYAHGTYDDGNWWIKFPISVEHELAWHAVQELGCVVNYLSINDRLPTRFYPVSPAPYLNGGPSEFLSWIIESTDAEFTPDLMAEWLEGRLPNPVDDPAQWMEEE